MNTKDKNKNAVADLFAQCDALQYPMADSIQSLPLGEKERGILDDVEFFLRNPRVAGLSCEVFSGALQRLSKTLIE